MIKTQVVQNTSHVLVSGDTYNFRIETTVNAAGELPTEKIFVFNIVDTSDPSLDTFARVATIADIDGTDALLGSRDDAISASASAYLASYFSIQFPDITHAVQAKSAITSRINDLINTWISYRDALITDSGDTQYFPTSDPDLEDSLIATYTAAKEARVAAEEDVTTAETDLASAQKDATNAQTIVGIYKAESDFCKQTNLTDWAALNPALTTVLAANASFLVNSKTYFCSLASTALSPITVTWPPTSGQLASLSALNPSWGSWYTAITTFETAQTTFNTTGLPAQTAVGSGLQTFCQGATANYASSLNNKAAMDSLVSDAVTTKKEAEAAVVTAQKEEDTALAAVKNVCPDFDPSTV